MSKTSTACKNKPTTQELFEGIQAVLDNSQNLYVDALLLLQSGRYPRAASLAILSIEEIGKAFILAVMSLTDDPGDIAAFWKDFQNHTSKNFPGVFVNRLLAGDRTYDELGAKLGEGAKDLNNVKKQGFYVDHLANNQWLAPTDVITASVAQHYVQIAGGIQMRGLTLELFELFIKHFKPLWKESSETKKQAMLNMLSHPETPAEFRNFMRMLLGES